MRRSGVERRELMLALSRRKGESVVIDGKIRVVVVDICGGKVRLGVEAPDDVKIFRGEILDKVDASNVSNNGEESLGCKVRDQGSNRGKKKTEKSTCLSMEMSPRGVRYNDVSESRERSPRGNSHGKKTDNLHDVKR